MSEIQIPTDLFDPRLYARASDPDTSRAAAETTEEIIARHVGAILRALRRDPHTGLTAELIGDAIGLTNVQVCRRLAAMELTGLIRRTDERKRQRSGRRAIIWRLS